MSDKNRRVTLNPNAQDFEPKMRRRTGTIGIRPRSTLTDESKLNRERTKNPSENHQQASRIDLNKPFQPLLSLMPELNRLTCAKDYRFASRSNLMGKTTQPDENIRKTDLELNIQRTRAATVRESINPVPMSFLSRQRSHSGPGTLISDSETHLIGVHSLAKMMSEILRSIPSPSANTESHPTSLSNTNLLIKNQYSQPSNSLSQGHRRTDNNKNLNSIQSPNQNDSRDASTVVSSHQGSRMFVN